MYKSGDALKNLNYNPFSKQSKVPGSNNKDQIQINLK